MPRNLRQYLHLAVDAMLDSALTDLRAETNVDALKLCADYFRSYADTLKSDKLVMPLSHAIIDLSKSE